MRATRAAIVPLTLLLTLALADLASAACTFSVRGRTMFLDASCTTEETIWIPQGFTLNGQGRTITAIEAAPGAWVGAIVQNEGPNANVKNLTLGTNSLACACKGGADRLAGIRLDGAGGKIANNTVFDLKKGGGCGCQEGIGIEIRNAPFNGSGPRQDEVKLDITNNLVALYQKGGVAVLGNASAKIHKNTVLGLQPIDYIAQNGIQVSYGASGDVHDNFVDGNYYVGASWASTGVLVFETDDVRVQDNTVVENQIGIGLEAWCWQKQSTDGNVVTGNDVTDAEWGITVAAYVLGSGYSACDPSASQNRITDNTLVTGSGEVGIYVGTAEYFCPCPPLDATAWRNEVRRNDITGFDTDFLDEGDDTRKAGGGAVFALVDPFSF